MTHLRKSPILRSLGWLAALGACVPVLLVLHQIDVDRPFVEHAVLDWIGHLVTALIVAIGVCALRLPIPVWSILVGGILLDLGHLPQILGVLSALEGSSRNGFHSLIFVAAFASIGFVDRRRANIWLGIAFGALSHLWRDMGTGTVPLMWPVRDTVYGTLFSRHLAALVGMTIAMIGTATLLELHAENRRQNSGDAALPASGVRNDQDGPISHASGWET